MVLSHATNIRWLTGFGGSLAWVVLDGERLVFVTDGRYARPCRWPTSPPTGSPTEGSAPSWKCARSVPELADAVVAAASVANTAVLAEAEHLSHAAWSALDERVPLEPARWGHRTAAPPQGRRRAGPDDECRPDRRRDARRPVVPMLAERPTEADVRDELEYRMRQAVRTARATTRSSPAGRSWPPGPITRRHGARSSKATP